MTIPWRDPALDLNCFQYSLGELNIAMTVDDQLDDFILVNVVETSYARKWSLSGGTDYQMSVNKSRILFCHESKRVVVGRGLLKWYCNSGNNQQGSVPSSENVRETFYLEISSGAARGPGIIEIYSVEKRNIQMGEWVHQRLFPNRTTECYENFCRLLASGLGGIYYCLIVCYNHLCCKGNRRSGNGPQQIVVDPKDPKQRRSLDEDSDFPRTADETSKTQERSSVEAHTTAEVHAVEPVKDSKTPTSGPSRAQSFKESMKSVPKKQSIKRIKSGMSKVVKNLTQNKGSLEDSSRSVYRSFEKLDDCFDIIDETSPANKLDYNRIFSIQSDEGDIDHTKDCVLDNVDDESSDSMEDLALGDSLATSNDSLTLRNSWYDKRKSTEDLQIKPHTTVAYDSTDNTVIVMDENDIYKVPQPELPSNDQFVSSCQIVVDKTIPFKAVITPPEESLPSTGNSPPNSSSSPDSSEWDKLEDPPKQQTVVTVEMGSQTNVSNPKPRPSKATKVIENASESRTKSVEKGLETLIRSEPLHRYVEQSQSLMSLRRSSKVGSAIKRFDSSASPEKKPPKE